MSAILKSDVIVSPEEYLLAEAKAKRKHEYLGGIVHAMAGGRNVHNKIAKNILVALDNRLQGKPCEPYNSDTKVRVRMPSGQIRFYYPDVQVICDPNSPEDSFQDKPVLVVEVTSRSTWRTDHVEKLEAYTSIAPLDYYVLVNSLCCEALVLHRTPNGFQRLKLSSYDDKVMLKSLGIELPLAEIYAGVQQFPVPPEDSDEDE